MERRKLVIVGAGGLARELIWQIGEANNEKLHYDIMGLVDALEPAGTMVSGFPVLGDDQWLLEYPDDVCAVICVANAKLRRKIYNNIKSNPRISFPAVISNNVLFSGSVKFGQGCIVCVSNVLTVDITVGDFAIINYGCTIGHDAVLGDFVTIYPGVNVSGGVNIGACTEIGAGTKIIQGKYVGENAIIGAGSVVVKDIPPNCVAVGVPATPIKELNG